MAGLWPGVLALLACLTDCLAVQSPVAAEVEWPTWVKLSSANKVPPQNKTAGKEDSALKKDKTLSTTAPPKPKRVFSDVDDLDFEPDKLVQVEKAEDPKDWDMEEDDRSAELEADGAVWTDPDMSSHNPHLRHGHRKTCTEKVALTKEDVHLQHIWLEGKTLLFDLSCDRHELMCDPIVGILKKILEVAKGADKVQNDKSEAVTFDVDLITGIDKFMNHVGLNMNMYTEFAELFESMAAKDDGFTGFSRHSLRNHKGNDVWLRGGMTEDVEDKILEFCDRDMSGTVSFGEFQACIYAMSIVYEYDLFAPICPTAAQRRNAATATQRGLMCQGIQKWIGQQKAKPVGGHHYFLGRDHWNGKA